MQLAESEAGPSVAAVGKASLEKLALNLLDLSEALDLPDRRAEPEESSRPLQPMGDDGGEDQTLRLDDMLANGNDEVVLLTDSGQGQLALATNAEVVATGTTGDHVTADGQDVSGFAFVTFATGMTLFYPEDVELAVCPVA